MCIAVCGANMCKYGYGSIPIHTIFRGMNIHLPANLMFTRGIGFWPIPISSQESQKLWSYTGIAGKTPEQDSVAPEKALICEKRKDDVTDSARDACWAKRLPWLEDLPSNWKTMKNHFWSSNRKRKSYSTCMTVSCNLNETNLVSWKLLWNTMLLPLSGAIS